MAHGSTNPDPVIQTMLLHLPKRRRLFEAIVARPGLHARLLSRQLQMALGVVEHHAYQLEKHNLVFSHHGGRRRTYFATGQVAPEDAAWIHALRKPEWGLLLAALVATGPCGVGPLSVRLASTPATVGYHLRRMRDMDLLDHIRVGRDSVYVVREPDRVRRLLVMLRPEAGGSVPDATFTGIVGRADGLAVATRGRSRVTALPDAGTITIRKPGENPLLATIERD